MNFFKRLTVVIFLISLFQLNITKAQLSGSVNSIIIPIGHVDLSDSDNEDFRWTVGLGFERKLSNRLYFRTMMKKEFGKYRTGCDDHSVSGDLNSFNFKTGFNYDIMQHEYFNMKIAMYYIYLFSESMNGFGYSPNFIEYFYEKEILSGIEPGIEIECKLIGGMWLFVNGGIQIGNFHHEWKTMYGGREFSRVEFAGLPFAETIGIKYKF